MKRIFLSFYLFVMITILALQFGFAPLVNHLMKIHFRNDIENYYRELTRGVFYTLIYELIHIEPERWDDHIAMLQPHYGFSLALQPLDPSHFSPLELAHLNREMIIVQDDGDTFSKRIGQSAYALQMGSFSKVGGTVLEKKVKTLVWITIPIFLSLLALLWAYPFWRNLKKIRTAAIAFGEGDFSTRATIKPHSALMPVAEAFNSMADRIQQLIDSHRELTRAVSHELRTPLARIRFSLEMLSSAETIKKRQRHIEGIHSDVDDLDAMITELLTCARFDGQGLQLRQEILPLVPWLQETVAYVATELEEARFKLHVADGIKAVTAHFEPLHMGRAVTNLLRNAARYTRSRVELTVLRDGTLIRLFVDDDGPGVPDKERGRIFEPFVRLDESRSRDFGGFGLGLPIVWRVAQWHGGRVWVSQSPLGGARFTIEWPGMALPNEIGCS